MICPACMQAMNYICGAIIMYNSEEMSFWLFSQLM